MWLVQPPPRYSIEVFEVAIALVIVVVLVAAAMIPPMTLLWLGAALGSLGGLIGVPAGLYYHAKLWRAIRAEGLDTRGMWLRPHHLHARLPDDQLGPVATWFSIGAAAFVATLVGAVGVITGLVRLFAK